MTEEITTEPFAFDEDEGCIIACEPSPVRDLNSLLEGEEANYCYEKEFGGR